MELGFFSWNYLHNLVTWAKNSSSFSHFTISVSICSCLSYFMLEISFRQYILIFIVVLMLQSRMGFQVRSDVYTNLPLCLSNLLFSVLLTVLDNLLVLYYCCWYITLWVIQVSKTAVLSVGSHGFAVGIVTRLRAGRSGAWFSALIVPSLLQKVQAGSGFYPEFYLVDTRGSFLRFKRPENNANHSPSSSAEFNNERMYIPA